MFAFGANIEEYLHLVIPVISLTVERENVATSLRITAVQTIDGLSKKVNFSDHASRIIHPVVRVLSNPRTPEDLRAAIMDTLCVLLVQLGTDFAIFIPMINKVHIDHPALSRLQVYSPPLFSTGSHSSSHQSP